MEYKITFNDKYYQSDSIDNGRLAKQFFKNISTNIYEQAFNYYDKMREISSEYEFPLLYEEMNLYSCISTAINEITPIHVSEWSFGKDWKGRRPDFWCLHKETDNGAALNYFLEIKKGFYCINCNTAKEARQDVMQKNNIDLLAQLRSLKKISPNWCGFDDVFIGISIIHTYHHDGKELYSPEDFLEDYYNNLDKRANAQLIMSTLTLPDDMKMQWDDAKYKYISIMGIVITKSK